MNFSEIQNFSIAVLEIWLFFVVITIVIIIIMYELLMSIAVNRCFLECRDWRLCRILSPLRQLSWFGHDVTSK